MNKEASILCYCESVGEPVSAKDIVDATFPGKDQRYIHYTLMRLVKNGKLKRNEAVTPYRYHLQDRQVWETMPPIPTVAEVERYLSEWNSLTDDYVPQERALSLLFSETFPTNTDLFEVLVKCSVLNDFYSTHVTKGDKHQIAKYIIECEIDKRLERGDPTLVDDMTKISSRNNYSFASKYCSHHQPFLYPIYDYYVDVILRHFRKRDERFNFSNQELKSYEHFRRIIFTFRTHFNLDQFNYKQLDQYLWQLGKEYFPKAYSKKKPAPKIT